MARLTKARRDELMLWAENAWDIGAPDMRNYEETLSENEALLASLVAACEPIIGYRAQAKDLIALQEAVAKAREVLGG